MSDYRWFHAFDRDEPLQILEVLRDGPKIHPDPNCATRRHEGTLGIVPNCVYAYLGRTIETFGESALVLPIDAIKGKVSPFDTGGLINWIAPINGQSDGEKAAFLNAFTWPIGNLGRLLPDYPSNDAAKVRKYLLGVEPPDAAGPNVLWPSKKAMSPIWHDKNDWRAWTWEVRSPEKFDISRLEVWTCSPSVYPEIMDQVDALGPSAASWLVALTERYVHGGVSNLVETWISKQGA